MKKSMTELTWLTLMCVISAAGLAFCHPTDRPPIPVPKPTDPTSMAELTPTQNLDASIIITDAGTAWDGAGYELDTGALGRVP